MTHKYEIDKKLMMQSFNRASISYDAAALIQREVSYRLMERLDIFNVQPTHILDVGVGTGLLFKQLRLKYPTAQIYGVDMAYQMLLKAKNQVSSLQNAHYICSDALWLAFEDNSFDMIVSNMAVHWCEDLLGLFQELHRVLKPNGILLFSTLGPDTLHELRQSWQSVDDDTHVNYFLDMHHVGDMMLETKWQDPVMDMEYLSVQYQSVKELMRDLKALGARNMMTGRFQGLTGKNRLQQMIANYEALRGTDGLLPATYEVIYGHALGNSLPIKYGINTGKSIEIPLTAIKKRSS